ncbi:MAG: hypothetical protein AAF639_40665, partial [Chloroflexota bacterium]
MSITIIDKETQTQFNDYARANGLLPIKVTPHYRKLVEKEVETLGRTGGPLYNLIFVQKEGDLTKLVQREANSIPLKSTFQGKKSIFENLHDNLKARCV